MLSWNQLVCGLLIASCPVKGVSAGEVITIEPGMQHVRQAEPREWSEFPETAESRSLERSFVARQNDSEWTLRLRHENVKQNWEVSLNGKRLAALKQNENSMVVAIAIPPSSLKEGENKIAISTRSNQPDDVRLGDVRLIPASRTEFLSQCSISVACRDNATGTQLPCRITILDANGSLHDAGVVSNQTLAVRTGVIYTSNGMADFGLPPGRFRIIASRGPEYTIDEQEINLSTDENRRLTMSLKRVVDTTGWVACDTHVHTLTHSGHGDASIEERLITICGEGIELPIATDHNKQIKYVPLQTSMGLTNWFTPVVGNEVTTKWGHFNIFPVSAGGPVPNHNRDNW
ncbi:MAG TPA: hypothetical protein VLA12_21295, partial [Planctomycetaceae bacterium]|nr:hypothetical protein [Planctomycetaceae bacterium]